MRNNNYSSPTVDLYSRMRQRYYSEPFSHGGNNGEDVMSRPGKAKQRKKSSYHYVAFYISIYEGWLESSLADQDINVGTSTDSKK